MMKLTMGMSYKITAPNNDIDFIRVEVSNVHRNYNSQTGQVLPFDELRGEVQDIVTNKLQTSISEIPELRYIPHTLEMLALKLWEWLEGRLSYQAKLESIEVVHNQGFFVKYVRKDVEMVREPQPQKSPKLRKRRKIYNGKRRKDNSRLRRNKK